MGIRPYIGYKFATNRQKFTSCMLLDDNGLAQNVHSRGGFPAARDEHGIQARRQHLREIGAPLPLQPPRHAPSFAVSGKYLMLQFVALKEDELIVRRKDRDRLIVLVQD